MIQYGPARDWGRAIGLVLLLIGMAVLTRARADGMVDAPNTTSDIDLVHRLAVGLGAVAIIGLIGWAAVILARRYGLPTAMGNGARRPVSVRVIDVRRITPRLHIATIQVSEDRAVVLADNGQSIVVIAETPLASRAGIDQ